VWTPNIGRVASQGDGYALRLSEAEVARYRFMAEVAGSVEAPLWEKAGIGPGARVADIGCGPGALLPVYAGLVGADGSVTGLDGDPAAVEAARAYTADLSTVDVRVGRAEATGLEPGAYDVVTIRHVLAHNGPLEADIVAHAASLLRPGGCLYLVDIDATAMRFHPPLPPELSDLDSTYRAFHAARGNDLQPGLRLGERLTTAGLEMVEYRGQYVIQPLPPGLRPPAWAAREAMRAAGIISDEDLTRWERGMLALDADPGRPTLFAPSFVAIGRR
jgi:SAM-dependent methyltransferase